MAEERINGTSVERRETARSAPADATPKAFASEASRSRPGVAQLIAAIEELKETLRLRDVRAALPETAQLLTPREIMKIFQISHNKLYDLKLPRYIHRGLVRYRVSDLPDHVRRHMTTYDGKPLERRRRNASRSERATVNPQAPALKQAA